MLVDDLIDLVGNAAQVSVDHIAVDIDGRSDIVMAYAGRFLPANQGGYIAQNLNGLNACRRWGSRARRCQVETGRPYRKNGSGTVVAPAALEVIGIFSRSLRDCSVYCGDCATIL